MTTRPSAAAPILAVLAILLALLGAYVGGYFWLGDPYFVGAGYVEREFPHLWQARLYRPMAWLEQRLSGTDVELTYHGDANWHMQNRRLRAGRASGGASSP